MKIIAIIIGIYLFLGFINKEDKNNEYDDYYEIEEDDDYEE